jgi:hypothetical protein
MSLTINQLVSQLPSALAAGITETLDDVTISVKTLLGKSSVQLEDAVLADLIHDLLMACNAAQVAYNTNNPSSQINSFNNPVFSAASRNSDGTYGVNTTFTVVTRSPVDFSATSTNP